MKNKVNKKHQIESRIIEYSGITTSYQNLSTPFKEGERYTRIANGTDQDITICFDIGCTKEEVLVQKNSWIIMIEHEFIEWSFNPGSYASIKSCENKPTCGKVILETIIHE